MQAGKIVKIKPAASHQRIGLPSQEAPHSREPESHVKALNSKLSHILMWKHSISLILMWRLQIGFDEIEPDSVILVWKLLIGFDQIVPDFHVKASNWNLQFKIVPNSRVKAFN